MPQIIGHAALVCLWLLLLLLLWVLCNLQPIVFYLVCPWADKVNFLYLLESRWRLFGHILRRNSEIPANKLMNSYFISHGSKFRGRPLTTLPVVLNKDLTRVSDDKLQLTSLKDLEHLRSVAQNRQTWRKLRTRIREAAEASPLDD